MKAQKKFLSVKFRTEKILLFGAKKAPTIKLRLYFPLLAGQEETGNDLSR